ncbi:amino acid permease [Pelistega sp. NLN82]|uniref:Amino acid permease n=1 Tax=Pelistega ratti TaxID=2652177 RepID=A0A6L9Y7H7_9BURK|nr:amino acid permease [Pelistega ratti]NEN76283.1 amino acid permease [Pelistega ratti]
MSHVQEQGLQRKLQNRHLQLIAIGGAIGTGLFMGSGRTISLAGPSVLFTYMIIGFFLFFVMRAMGELLLSNLNYKSFTDFTYDLLGPCAGFFVGWTYWFCWLVLGIADIIAITNYAQFWWPDIPLWMPGVICIATMCLMNLLTVKLFGEVEFWFALIKVIAIIALVFVGIYLLMTGFVDPTTGIQASVTHLWAREGGMFPHGISGFFAAFQIAFFAFVGIELVGTAAAETQDPCKNLPAAINRIPIRVVVFYVLALCVIMTVTPWDKVVPDRSPFVNMFMLIGIPAAASIVNLVVLTSAMSSANSGVFSTGRMLYGLAETKSAPRIFSKLNKGGVPALGLLYSSVYLLIGVFLLYQDGNIMKMFTIVTTVSSIGFMFVWIMILVCYIKYAKTRPALHQQSIYKLPGGAMMAWACLIFLLFAFYLFSQDADTLKGLLAMPVWFGLLGISYLFYRKHHTTPKK